ncbi:Methyl-accepting chemotaxis protein [Sulfidibacter corallicola]|uniref:Methyl-accepting chemotaxis protein n=1 Tax=Sulfidibacter corallicola TaxID=2818388 RepID=A0A8A4TGX8_SULCO|nr:methyl-accepting chemotaxis protein [Sulfidibacter corallicola]QTD48432.1 methyl-accepting chemotaxis protein [Sulfidibacter corallicola]
MSMTRLLRFHGLNVKTRLYLLSLFLFLPFGGIILYFMLTVNEIKHQARAVYEDHFMTVVALKDCQFAISQLVHAGVGLSSESILFESGQEQILAYGQGEDKAASLPRNWTMFDQRYRSLDMALTVDRKGAKTILSEKELVSQLRQGMGRFQALLDQVIRIIGDIDEDDFEASEINVPVSEMSYLGIDLENTIQDLVLLEERKVQDIEDRLEQRASQVLFRVQIAFVLLVLFGFTYLWFLARSVGAPLSDLTQFCAEFLETGRLDRAIDIDGDDEIGRLGRYFNEFMKKFRTLLKQIQAGAHTLSEASLVLSEQSREMSNHTEQLNQYAGGIADLVREMEEHVDDAYQGVDQVSVGITDLSRNISEIDEAVGQISENTTTAANESRLAENKSSEAASQMDQLEQSVSMARNIVSTIEKIAESCKLLALNAGIEAVRVGDHGKGFTVVANEVKELSKQTSAEVNVISGHIQEMVDAIGAAKGHMEEIANIIRQVEKNNSSIADAVHAHRQTTNRASHRMGENAEALRKVQASVQTATALFQKVAGSNASEGASIRQLVTVAELVGRNVAVVDGHTAQLAQMAEKLRESVAGYQV